MEVFIGLKFKVDETTVEPKLGNRYGGKVEVAMKSCVVDAVAYIFNNCPDIVLTHANVAAVKDNEK